MALEAVVFPQDPFGYGNKDLYNLLGSNFSYDFKEEEEKISLNFLDNQTENLLYGEWDSSHHTTTLDVPQVNELHQANFSLEANNVANSSASSDLPKLDSSPSIHTTRSKRRRPRTRKNKEDIESQRMTHIAVERNRRKQMNEYLSIMRSLMPESYVQRGDQASIIGGAINFVKELEQQLHVLGAQKEMKEKTEGNTSLPFSDFFTFPQYSTNNSSHHCEASKEAIGSTKSAIADIEVTMVECHANLKIRSRRQPKQFLRMVSWLHCMHLTILHLNVTTVDQIVLYSLCVKVEEDSKLSTVDEIAKAVYQMLGRIQEEAL